MYVGMTADPSLWTPTIMDFHPCCLLIEQSDEQSIILFENGNRTS